jgi:serine protease
VELVNGEHELRPEDVGDLFTWMVTFYRAYLEMPQDPGAMGRFIRMASVTGGRQDNLSVDVHVPLANRGGETTAVELYNTNLNHYVLITDPAEYHRMIDEPGSAWEVTGQGFKAWPQLPSDTFVTAVPVCRFDSYRRSGPSSAFYTASVAECNAVKSNRFWSYRGVPWYIQPVDASQRCPDGYLGVNRAYNQGHVRNDSNHRFTTSDSTIREMEREGWIYEGMAMCSRP